jgi:hypothetical protein
MENKVLSISIPTFSRPEILRENILLMLPEIREFSVPVYISDDSLDILTENMIAELRKDYKYIYYYRNDASLGHDSNMLHTLKLPKTEYVWLLGDSIILKRGAIENVLEIITQIRPQIIGVNAKNRDLDINSTLYDDPNEVLDQFGWHLTLTGTTIYSNISISTIHGIDIEENTNFPQIALIFNHLLSSCSFYWINKRWLFANDKKLSYWSKDLFKVFIDDWSNVIRNLPTIYTRDKKEKVILEHSRKLKLFGLRSLLKARYLDAYNLIVFKKYQEALVDHSGLSLVPLLVILLIPKTVLRIILEIKGNYKIIINKVFVITNKIFET